MVCAPTASCQVFIPQVLKCIMPTKKSDYFSDNITRTPLEQEELRLEWMTVDDPYQDIFKMQLWISNKSLIATYLTC